MRRAQLHKAGVEESCAKQVIEQLPRANLRGLETCGLRTAQSGRRVCALSICTIIIPHHVSPPLTSMKQQSQPKRHHSHVLYCQASNQEQQQPNK